MIKIVKEIEKANSITHCGTMHADEVFATAFLEMLFGDRLVYRTSDIDYDKVSSDAIIYDVGRGEFDHHQLDALKRDNGITYCSFGLLWKRFGREFLKKEGYYYIDELFEMIDKDFVEAIDADDNGVFPKIESLCKVKTISNMVKLFNPSFDSCQVEDDQFVKAVNVCKSIFEEEILYCNGKVIADITVNEVIDTLGDDEKYLVLDKFLPYEESIINNPKANNVLFVAFPSNRGGYAIKTVPKGIDDKTARMMFPIEWAGLTDCELEKVSNIKGLTFCHTGRFIVSCRNISVVYQVLDKLTK